MPSRGVVPGDVMRADAAWNERIGAAGEGAGVDVETPGQPQVMGRPVAQMLSADLFTEEEARSVMSDLVYSYTGVMQGTIFEILLSMCGHALATGVLTERQRWDGEGVSLREARLPEIAVRVRNVIDQLEGLAGFEHELDDLRDALKLTGVDGG